MNQCTNWNVLKWKCVTRLNVGIRTANYGIANFEAFRLNDVSLLTVCIVQKSDARCAVWIVLNCGDLCWYAILVTLEIDYTITCMISATLVTAGNATIVVATCFLRLLRKERFLRL